MPWTEILMLTIGVALIVTMICTGHAPKQSECGAFQQPWTVRPALRRPRSSAFCRSHRRSAPRPHAQGGPRFPSVTLSPLYGFLAKLAVKPKATAFFYTYIGNGGDVPLTR
jgi:hypothetical protein